jgi:hypothetical protein
MLVSLYSGGATWVMVPGTAKPPGTASHYGSLVLEATVPSALIPEAIRERLNREIRTAGFCQASEELGITLIDECLARYGTLVLPASPRSCRRPPGRFRNASPAADDSRAAAE